MPKVTPGKAEIIFSLSALIERSRFPCGSSLREHMAASEAGSI
jgi:hypothetical protein